MVSNIDKDIKFDRWTLMGTPAKEYHRGEGWAIMAVRNGVPSMLIYLPEDTRGMDFEEVVANVDFSNIHWEDGARDITDVFLGLCSRLSAYDAYMRLGEPDYRKPVYGDGEIVIEYITGDLYITGYKAEKKRYAVRLDEQDFVGVKKWALNFKPDAEVWTRYKEDYSGRWTIVRLYDKDGEEAHILEACGDGRFTENDYNSYCAATLESYDAEDELIEEHRVGYVHELGAKRWVW